MLRCAVLEILMHRKCIPVSCAPGASHCIPLIEFLNVLQNDALKEQEMSYTTLISAEQLQALVASTKPLRIFACTFDLMQPGAGKE